MLSLVELDRVAKILSKNLAGGRIERWLEPEPGRIAFSIYRSASGDHTEKIKCIVDLDARSEIAHVGIVKRMPKAPTNLPAFSAYLRAHLSRARLRSVLLRGHDRQLELRFEAEAGEFVLLFCVFGRRSNLYLLDGEDSLLLALRPLAETRSELSLGQPYANPTGGGIQAGEDRFAAIPGESMLEAIADHYAAAIQMQSKDTDRRRLQRALKKERKSAQRRADRIEAELAEAEEVNTLQHHGELLKANLARIVPGKSEVTVADFETGAPVEIKIDPRLSPKENLDATFKRYQKLLRRLTKAGGQVESVRVQLQTMQALESEVEASPEIDEILTREFVVRLLAKQSDKRANGPSGAIASKPKLPAVYRDRPRKVHPRRYRSEDGLEIWVGRNDEGNDLLTTRFARGKDLFFHLDGAPGSHVILRTGGQSDPPPASILDACELAVHFSKQKNAGQAEVHIVPIKNVKKPKGAKPGLVYVTGGKSIRLRREPARLERLQKARIED
jgi:predicted ribosome quality control (RQC) complex YloA/Tae2 family protein